MEGTFYQMLFDLFLYTLIYKISKNNLKFNNNNTVLFCLILVFCIYPFWGGDYFHYYESYIDYKKCNAYTWIDPIYDRFMDFSPTYGIWRIIVWGTGLISVFWASKILDIETNQFIYYFTVFLLLVFSYARVSLGMSILLLGYAFIIQSKKNIFKICLGIITIIISMFFHKSLILPILVSFISFVKLNRKLLIVFIIIIPIIIIFIRNHFETLAYASGILNEEQMAKAASYTSGEKSKELGIAAIINNILQYLPIYYSVFFLTRSYYKYYPSLDFRDRSLYKISLFMCIASNIFLFIPNAYTMFYRMLTLSKFPTILAICRYKDIIPVINIKRFVFFSIISSFYMLLYALYLTH